MTTKEMLAKTNTWLQNMDNASIMSFADSLHEKGYTCYVRLAKIQDFYDFQAVIIRVDHALKTLHITAE